MGTSFELEYRFTCTECGGYSYSPEAGHEGLCENCEGESGSNISVCAECQDELDIEDIDPSTGLCFACIEDLKSTMCEFCQEYFPARDISSHGACPSCLESDGSIAVDCESCGRSVARDEADSFDGICESCASEGY